MKRLTVRNRDGEAAVLGYASSADIMDKLARYEDTGVEPEELQEVVACLGAACEAVPEELKSWAERCLWHVRKCDELRRELNEAGALRRKVEHAELEGRLWVLPVALGAVLWRVAEIGAKLVLEPLKLEKIELMEAGVQLILSAGAEWCGEYDAEYIGSELFLTAAEAAEELMRRQTSRSFRATDDEGAAAGEPSEAAAVAAAASTAGLIRDPRNGGGLTEERSDRIPPVFAEAKTTSLTPTSNASYGEAAPVSTGEQVLTDLFRKKTNRCIGGSPARAQRSGSCGGVKEANRGASDGGGEGQSLVHPQADARHSTYKVKCAICGREFDAGTPSAKLCSAECKAARKREQAREYYAKNAEELKGKARLYKEKKQPPKGAVKGGMSVEEIAREAKAAGMSYGEYVRWLEEQGRT